MASKSAGASHSTNAAGPLSANIFFAFNTSEPYQDKAHIFDRDGRVVHGRRFGLSLGDGLSLARVMLTPEAMLGRAAYHFATGLCALGLLGWRRKRTARSVAG